MEIMPLSSLYSTLPNVGWRRLEAHNGSVARGFDVNLVTPFLPHEVREEELSYGSWYAKHIASSQYPEFNAVEEAEAAKFGPFSIRAPYAERQAGVYEYFRQHRANEALLYASFDRMRRWIPKGSLRPYSFTTSYGAMPKNSNLGLPHFTRDRSLAPEYLRRATELKAAGFRGDCYPAVLGWRGQPNGTSKPKQRVVWMMDHLQTIVGLSVLGPTLAALRPRVEFAAWNDLHSVDKVATSFIDRTSGPIFSIDFSGFDRSLPTALIHMSFELLRTWFIREAKPQIDWLEHTLLTVGLVTPEGIFTKRDGGMPSGDAMTNLIDSLSQLLLLYLFAEEGSVLGDDGFYLLSQGGPETISEFVQAEFGMLISASKGSYESGVISYLQRTHLSKYRRHGLCVGVRSLTRMWNGACHRERGHSGLPPEFYSARTIMQLENCKWHPRFRSGVKHFYSVDKYVREMDVMTIFKRAGGVEHVEDILGLKGFRFGSELPSAGLLHFETVKLLNELRSARRK